eukprot:gene28336-34212_t
MQQSNKSASISQDNNSISHTFNKDDDAYLKQVLKNARATEESHQESVKAEGGVPKAGYLLSKYDISMLGVVTVVGGTYYGWNTSLEYGFGYYIIAVILVATAFIIYCFCISEITSAIPFSGGAYGLSRVAQGFYIGFIVGCCQALEYICYASAAALFIAEQLCLLLDIDSRWELIFLFAFYATATAVYLNGNRALYYANIILYALCILFPLVFFLSVWGKTNFVKYAALSDAQNDRQKWFAQGAGFMEFLKITPITAQAYGGIEALSSVVDEMRDARQDMAFGIISSVLTLFVIHVVLTFTVASLPPGLNVIAQTDLPMSYGFEIAWNVPRYVGTILLLPPQYAMGFGFILPYAKLLHSFAQANLTPSWFMLTDQPTHHRAVVVTNTIGFGIGCILYSSAMLNKIILNTCVIFGVIVYISQLHGYYVLSTTYSSIKRSYRSPLGLYGAGFAVLLFLFLAASILASEGTLVIALVGGLVFVLSIYYFFFAMKTQRMAPDEAQIMLNMYVIRMNYLKAGAKKKGKSKSSVAPSLNLSGASGSRLKVPGGVASRSTFSRSRVSPQSASKGDSLAGSSSVVPN